MRYPIASGRGIYTTPDAARDLGVLNAFVTANAAPDATNSMSRTSARCTTPQRRPPVRCFDVALLSVPSLARER